MIRRVDISKSNVTLSGSSPRRQCPNTDGRKGARFGIFHEFYRFVWEICFSAIGKTFPNDLVLAGCPGKFIFDEIL